MMRLSKALHAWGTTAFEDVLKREIEQLDAGQLPLQQGLSTSSYAVDNNLNAIIISVSEDEGSIYAKVGIFYTGIIAGCSCADDPTPVDENSEYCELQFTIDKLTAETMVSLVSGK